MPSSRKRSVSESTAAARESGEATSGDLSNLDLSLSSDSEEYSEQEEDEEEESSSSETNELDTSSDEEWGNEERNTVGNVPMEWYEDEEHLGYNIKGERLMKPTAPGTIGSEAGTRLGIGNNLSKAGILQDSSAMSKTIELDRFLERSDNPDYWRTVRDVAHQKDVVLSADEYRLVRSFLGQAKSRADGSLLGDPHEDFIDRPFTQDPEAIHPVWSAPPPKSQFVPSKWERMHVRRLVAAIRRGDVSLVPLSEQRKAEKEAPRQYKLLWDDAEDPLDGASKSMQRRRNALLPPPKMALPGHAASYNPSDEFLLSDRERTAWEAADPSDRATDFIPQKFANLRSVPLYQPLIREQFDRCLDLLLSARVKGKAKLNIDPESLLPQLPKPEELRPFPTHEILRFVGHTQRIRTVAFEPRGGQWMVTGSDDCSVRLWEVETGRCVGLWRFSAEDNAFAGDEELDEEEAALDDAARATESGPSGEEPGGAPAVVHRVLWHPRGLPLLAVAVGDVLTLIVMPQIQLATAAQRAEAEEIASGAAAGFARALGPHSNPAADSAKPSQMSAATIAGDEDDSTPAVSARRSVAARALPIPAAARRAGVWVRLQHAAAIKHLAWHHRGDYVAALAPDAVAKRRALAVHQLSSGRSQTPFGRKKGSGAGNKLTWCEFHPTRPSFILATQRHIRIYDLAKMDLEKKLVTGVQWLAALDVHPGGDNIVACSYDRRVVWFDLDLSVRPYRTLRFHKKAVRRVQCHKRYPLFASCSDDLTVQVLHANTFPDDLLKNPLLVPLKILRGHSGAGELGILDLAWHPIHPWLATVGADHSIRLWV